MNNKKYTINVFWFWVFGVVFLILKGGIVPNPVTDWPMWLVTLPFWVPFVPIVLSVGAQFILSVILKTYHLYEKLKKHFKS